MYLKQQLDMSIRHDIKIPIDHHQSNVPITTNTEFTKKELDTIEPHSKFAMVSFNCNSAFTDNWNIEVDEFKYEFDSYSKMCCSCVGVEDNLKTFTLALEIRYQHASYTETHACTHCKIPNGKHSLIPTMTKPKLVSISNCPVLKCTSCELPCAKKHNPQVVWQHAIKEKKGILALNKFHADDFISMDQFVVSTSGWLLTAYGWEGNHNRFYGWTILNDAATGAIWVKNQVSLGAGEIIMAKTCFKEWLGDLACAEIKHHSNNGVFAPDVFHADSIEKHWSQSFSGVGAHH